MDSEEEALRKNWPDRLNIFRNAALIDPIVETALEFTKTTIKKNVAYLCVDYRTSLALIQAIMSTFSLSMAQQLLTFLLYEPADKEMSKCEKDAAEYLEQTFTKKYILSCVNEIVKYANSIFYDGYQMIFKESVRTKLVEIFDNAYKEYIHQLNDEVNSKNEKETAEGSEKTSAQKNIKVPFGEIQEAQLSRYVELKATKKYPTDVAIYRVIAEEFFTKPINVKVNIHQANKAGIAMIKKHIKQKTQDE